MIAVESSNISGYLYSSEKNQLGIQFNSGKLYIYSEVSLGDLNKFLNAPSKGQHFNQFIRQSKPVEAFEGTLDEFEALFLPTKPPIVLDYASMRTALTVTF